jgi:enamine deaminase RidA (YjgF/YER057c/UK114 family)
VATYVPAVVVGNVLYAAGHTPRLPDGTPGFQGKLGEDMTVEQGQEAARWVALLILSTVRNTIGSLDRVARLVRTFGMVNGAPDFIQQPQVINGFSDFMVDVFGEEAGKGTRAAVGMGSLPAGMAVEIETYWEIRG